MHCATLAGLSGTSALFSAAMVAWCGWRVFSQDTSKFCESLCAPGSGEELRLLSALPEWPLAEAAGCLAARLRLVSRVPEL